MKGTGLFLWITAGVFTALLATVMAEASSSLCSGSDMLTNMAQCGCKTHSLSVNSVNFGEHNPLSINEKRRMLITTNWAPDVLWGVALYTEGGTFLNKMMLSPLPPFSCLSKTFTLPLDLVIRREATDPSSIAVVKLVFFAFHPDYNPVTDYFHCNTSLCQHVTAVIHFTPSMSNIHLNANPGNQVTRGASATLTCRTNDGYPPVSSYYWLKTTTKDSKTVVQELQGTMFNSQGVLEIVNAQEFHEGIYKCIAVNYPFGYREKTLSKLSIALTIR